MKKIFVHKLGRLILPTVFCLGLFSANISQAQLTNYIWNGSTSNWITTTAWTPSWTGQSSSAESNNIAVFTNTGTFTNIDLSSNRTVGGILFTTNAYAYTINSANSKVLTIWDKGLTNNSGKTQTFNLGVTIGGGDAPLFAGASSTNVFAGTMTLGSTSTGREPSFRGTGYTIVSGNIVNNSSPSDLTKPGVSIDTTAGAGVFFSGTNTYTGRTTIGTSGAILTVDRVSALSSASYLNFLGSSGTRTDLNLGGNGLSYTMNYFQAGGGGWINTTNAANTATLTFTNTSNQNAATGTTSRMLGVGTGVSVIFSGDYNIAGTNTGKAMTFTVDGAGSTTFNGSFNGGANGNLTNGLIKNGSGVMNLNASNSLSTTATAINGGTVNLGNDYALGTASVSMNSNSAIGVSSGTRTTANNIAMASGITGTFRADSAVDWTNSGNITDATGLATLNKTGTGTLSLSGANTYKDTTVTAGTLNARSAGALGAGTVTVSSGATLGVVGASVANVVKNSGTVSIGAAGTLAASTMAPAAGGQGALVLGGTVGNSATFNSTVASGTSSASSTSQLGDLTMNGNSVLNLQNIYTQINAATVTFAGTGNSIGLNGKSALWGANTYTLLSGTGMSGANSNLLLDLGGGNTVALGSSRSVGAKTYSFSQSGTTLTMGITSEVIANQVWDSNISSGAWNTTAQNWLNDGTGSAVAFNSGDNAALNSTATITVDAGGITASAVTLTNSSATVTLDGGNLTGTTLSKSGGTLLMNNSANSFIGLTNSAGTLTSTGTLTAISGGVTASGGTVNLNGANSIGGGLLVNGGAVALGAASTLSSDSITVSSGSLDVGASVNNGVLTISGGSIAGVGTLTNTSVSATGGTIATTLAGTGGLTKTGAGTLNLNNSVNSFTGGVIVTEGTLVAGTANNLSGESVTVNGGTLDIGAVNNTATSVALSSGAITGTTGTLSTALTATVLNGVTASVSAILTGSNSLTKYGSGTLMLSGSNSYTGSTTINLGTLATSGNNVLADSGTVNIGSGGTFRLGGNDTVGAVIAATNAANPALNLQGYTLTLGGTGLNMTNGAITTGTGGSIVKNGTGLLYMNNSSSTYSGGFTLNAGEVAYTSSGDSGAGGLTNSVFGTGNVNLNGGILGSSSDTSARNLFNNIVLNGGVQLGKSGTAATLTIRADNNASTTLTSDVNLTNIAKVDYQQAINGSSYRLTKYGAILTNSAGTLNILSLQASNNIAGVTVNAGAIGYRNRNAFGSGTLILADGVVVGQDGSINNTGLTGNDQTDRSLVNNIQLNGNVAFGLGTYANHLGGAMGLNNGTRTITLSNSTYQYGAVSNGGLVIDSANSTGNRVFAMFASNNYSGGTVVRTNGVLEVGNDNALGTSDLTFTNTTGSGIATLRASTLSTNAKQVRTITNNIQLATGSVVTLDTVNSVQNSIGTTNAVALDLVLAGNISGAGGLIKSNTNTVTLRGANSYSGATTVVQGTLVAITNNISSTITSNTIAITFSNVPANGTYAVLPGALAGQTYTATYSNLAPKTATFSTASPASVTVSSADQTTPVSAEFGSAKIAVGDTTSVTAIGGDGTGDYVFRQNGGTGLVEISGTGASQTIKATAEGEPIIEVRRLADNNYKASDWFVAGTLIVNPAGNTYNSVGFAAGTENEIAENGLSNLMNYALGQNGPNAPLPAPPVMNSTGSEINLYFPTARTGDTSLKFFGQWTSDLSLNDWEQADHSTELTPPILSYSQTIDPNEPKKFIRFKIEKQ